MSEKVVLVDKLPPTDSQVQPIEPVSTAVVPLPSGLPNTSGREVSQLPSVTVEREPVYVVPEETMDAIDTAYTDINATTEEPATEPVQATGFQKITFYSYLFDLVLFGMLGVFFVAQGVRHKSTVRFKSMIGYGIFLFVLAGSYFIAKGSFNAFLWGEVEGISLMGRGITWMLLAPFLFYLLSGLIRVQPKDVPIYVTMFIVASALFAFIAISNIGGASFTVKLVFSLASFACSAALIAMLFFTIGSLPENVSPGVRRGAKSVIIVIALGWFMYPFFNFMTQLNNTTSVYPFLLNIIDAVTLVLISVAFYKAAGTNMERMQLKPAFRKAKLVTAAMNVSQAEAAEAASPKPTFRKPTKHAPRSLNDDA